jgi:predicted phosphodiesterase
MTRFAIISDIHGNYAALESVLRRIDRLRVDEIICLGDVVGYGPRPDACLNTVMRRCAHVVQGNHDEAVLDPAIDRGFNENARAAIRWTRSTLGPLHLAAICNFPTALYLGRDTVCFHDTPNRDQTNYLNGAGAAALAFTRLDRPICLVGHTHVPLVFECDAGSGTTPDPETITCHRPSDGMPIPLRPDGRYICNPGSVGQPRDADPRASFAILDLDRRSFTVHREEYDIVATQLETQRVGLPLILARRLDVGA